MVLELPIFHEMHMLWIDVPKDILQRFDSATDRIDQQRDLELHGSLSQKCWSFVALPDTSLPQILVIRVMTAQRGATRGYSDDVTLVKATWAVP